MHALTRNLNRLTMPIVACIALQAHAQQGDCGDPRVDANAPMDFRTATHAQRLVVERRHYTAEVRSLRSGTSTSDVGADVAYTLNRFPNHHAALLTMGEWSLKTGKNPPRNVRHSVECWFARAALFRPDDQMVKVVYGIYLIKKGKPEEAVKQFEAAIDKGETSANVYYNLGLAYLGANQFDKALESAHRAYALGFPLPGLRNRLARAGKWRDPVAAVEVPDDSPAAAVAEPDGPAASDVSPPPAAAPTASGTSGE